MTQCGLTTKIFVMLFFHKDVVTFQRGQEGMHVHTQFVRQLTRAISTHHKTFADILISRLVVQANLFIEHDVGVVFWQTDDRGRNLVSGFHFIEETFTLLADQNRPTAADRFRDQIGRRLFHGRVDLDFAHIHGAGIDALQQSNT